MVDGRWLYIFRSWRGDEGSEAVGIEGCDPSTVEKVLVKYLQQDLSQENAAKILSKLLSKRTYTHAVQDATNLGATTTIPQKCHTWKTRNGVSPGVHPSYTIDLSGNKGE